MKNGIYEAHFTTDRGMLGSGAVLIKDGHAYGADDLQFYRGEITQSGEDLEVIMEVTRHNFAATSAFGNKSVFTLHWRGKSLAQTAFKMDCRPEGVDVVVYVSGRMLREHE
ncbi:GrlR family regulatory protein [Variovorax humicola]|uniref:GrlR family regulatory protein n=1 Tax=Variovorax humicola TaxID=1769758 RepID=A0ABU8W6Y2_9BURK